MFAAGSVRCSSQKSYRASRESTPNIFEIFGDEKLENVFIANFSAHSETRNLCETVNPRFVFLLIK